MLIDGQPVTPENVVDSYITDDGWRMIVVEVRSDDSNQNFDETSDSTTNNIDSASAVVNTVNIGYKVSRDYTVFQPLTYHVAIKYEATSFVRTCSHR